MKTNVQLLDLNLKPIEIYKNLTTIEIPPHSRTLKIRKEVHEDVYITTHQYIKLPYSQFYFINTIKIITSQSLIPLKELVKLKKKTHQPMWLANTVSVHTEICWGAIATNIPAGTNPKILLDLFWNSTFKGLYHDTSESIFNVVKLTDE